MAGAVAASPPEFLSGGGEMGALIRAKDWSATRLGMPQTWPSSLRTSMRIVLSSRYAMWMGWGEDLAFFYNDAYAPTLGAKHPASLGEPAAHVWREIWNAIGPRIDHVLTRGEATWDEALLLLLERHGYPEETYHTFSYSPLPSDEAGVAGMLCVVTEDTERVIGERRLRVLRELAAAIAKARTSSDVFGAVDATLAGAHHDVPFALTYLFDDADTATLVSSTGFDSAHSHARPTFTISDTSWPFARVMGEHTPVVIDLDAEDFPSGPWPRPPRSGIVLPIPQQGQARPAGVFIAGINRFRPLDESYRGFLDLLVGQIAAGLANARAYEIERRRTQALAEIDGAKAAIAAEIDLERVVQLVVDRAVELTGAKFGAFFYKVTDDKGESYTLYTLSGAPREAFARFPMPRSTGIFAPTFKGEGVVRSGNIQADPRYGQNPPFSGMPDGHLPVRSYLAVSVISPAREVVGGLFFGHPDVDVFDERAELIVRGIAAQAAIAIDNARLFRAQRNAEDALRKLNETLEQRVADEISARMKIEEALRHAQKMEAIGQLTGGAAHDFNNLMQVVLGNLDGLHRRTSGPFAEAWSPDHDRLLDAAVRGAERATTLTQRLLAFSRRLPLQPRPIDVNKLVGGMSELLQRTLGEKIAVETVLGAGLWRVWADANQLESTLLNLAVNARDAMVRGGLLTIETANAHLDEIYASAHEEIVVGEYVLIAVTDTGSGMTEDVMTRAFEPFFTTKDVGYGTGLGLSQVYGFVKQSGGHVKIDSELERGTTVKVYLPRLAADGTPGNAVAGAAQAQRS